MTDAAVERLAEALADRYRLEAVLGTGASATVYLAEDLRHGRQVALKVLHSALGAALGVERFQREIRTQARLQHPHILPLFDSGSAAGRLYYTMPYVATGSLRDRLRREGPLELGVAVGVAGEVASALTYAHGQGVIHRDLKPENILLSPTGHALLSDFGIACALDDTVPGAPGRLTETGVTLGTPAYMSPEQSAGDEAVDARTDVYSLAAVVYEALTGKVPFEGANARAIMARRLTEAPPSVRALRPEVPAPVDAALVRAMARHPEERFESVAAFARALALPDDGTVSLPSPVPAQRQARRPGARVKLLPVLAALIAVLFAAGGWLLWRRLHAPGPAGDGGTLPVVAVLPFKNLGPAADQYFADGLTEELTSRLAGLAALRVISRTSAEVYRGSPKPVRVIGAELGATYVLEGSVRWARGASGAGRLRVTPQLIRVADDRPVWAGAYEAELGEVFALQAQLAEQVTTALDVALRAPEKAALAAAGTRNPEAYDFYLRGLDYLARSNQEADIRSAIRLFEQSVAADPRFAQAQARLSRANAQLYWHYYDRTDERLRMARQAADAAAALAPDLPETHVALGYYYYWGMLDYGQALREFELARRQQPGNAELLQAIAYVERRRGRWDESLARFVEALRYDPRSGVRSFEAGDNYLSLHLFPEAEHYLDRAITLSPDWVNPYVYKAWLYVIWRGDMEQGRAVMREGLAHVQAGRFTPGLLPGDRVSASLVTADSSFWPMLDDLSLAGFAGDSARYHLLKAEAAHFRRLPAAERAHGDSARVILEARLRARPDDEKMLTILGLAYSHVGRHQDAIRVARRAAERLPVERDAVSGPFLQSNLALIYMAAGQHDRAIDILARLRSIPSWITPAALRADPIWEPLRTHPRFRALTEETAPAT